MSNVICYDMDFPSFIWQAGHAGTDLMLVPANDFREHDPLHTQMASLRAIENGFILVRQAQLGLSMAVDYEGRVLATSDFFSTDQQTMIAYVPIHGVRTIYATIGDLFAWLSIAGLLFLTGLVILRRRQIRKTPARGFVEVVPEPELVH
jgi:apolipoprotein N-acyltransferase